MALKKRWNFKHDLQHGWHQLKNRDLMCDDCFHQISRIDVPTGFRKNKRCPREQWRIKLPDGGIEAEWRLLQHSITTAERKGCLHPLHVVDDRAMRNHDTLRTSC